MNYYGKRARFKSGTGRFRHTIEVSVVRSEDGHVYRISTQGRSRKKQEIFITPDSAVAIHQLLGEVISKSGDDVAVRERIEVVE